MQTPRLQSTVATFWSASGAGQGALQAPQCSTELPMFVSQPVLHKPSPAETQILKLTKNKVTIDLQSACPGKHLQSEMRRQCCGGHDDRFL